jgi:hypothetical protein
MRREISFPVTAHVSRGSCIWAFGVSHHGEGHNLGLYRIGPCATSVVPCIFETPVHQTKSSSLPSRTWENNQLIVVEHVVGYGNEGLMTAAIMPTVNVESPVHRIVDHTPFKHLTKPSSTAWRRRSRSRADRALWYEAPSHSMPSIVWSGNWICIETARSPAGGPPRVMAELRRI